MFNNHRCLIQDRAAMTEKYKEKLMKYMAGRLKILSRDSETCLTYNWIQEGIFEKLLTTCKRKEFFKFCRVVGPNYDDRSDQGKSFAQLPKLPFLFSLRVSVYF